MQEKGADGGAKNGGRGGGVFVEDVYTYTISTT